MKTKLIYIGVLIFLITSSCNKVIEIQETDLIAGSVALKNVTSCEQAIIGGYASVGTEMNILLNATFADEVKKAEFYNAATTHEWQFSSTDIGIRDNFTAITPNYTIIDRVNRVLAALPNADSTKAGDLVLKNKLRGEALFLRAYAHFELSRYYCDNYSATGLGMPYMTTASLDPQARVDMGAYFQKINADLTEAKNLVSSTLTDINRANKIAVAGLQARVALYMKDWTNAAAFATEYISAIPLSPIASFDGIWKDANTNEIALRIIRTTAVGPRIGSIFRGTSSSSAAIGTVTWMPTNKLWDSYDQVNDVRFNSYFKNEILLSNASRQPRLVQKYAGTTYGTSAENVANGKVFRTGEMYLIRAEARAELGSFTGANSAETDINDLRKARINGYSNVVFTSKTDAINQIMQERYKELAFEGHRFWDLKRRGLPVDRLVADAPSTTGTTLPAGDYRFTLPIPDYEIKSNPLMVQNNGYK